MPEVAPQIDHAERGKGRFVTQYRESTDLLQFADVFLQESNALESAIQQILKELALFTARGVQLDILGEIVGQDREFIDAAILGYFGYGVN